MLAQRFSDSSFMPAFHRSAMFDDAVDCIDRSRHGHDDTFDIVSISVRELADGFQEISKSVCRRGDVALFADRQRIFQDGMFDLVSHTSDAGSFIFSLLLFHPSRI